MENSSKDKLSPKSNEPQTSLPTKSDGKGKHEPPVATPVTDNTKNIADQREGLNQDAATREDLLPLD